MRVDQNYRVRCETCQSCKIQTELELPAHKWQEKERNSVLKVEKCKIFKILEREGIVGSANRCVTIDLPTYIATFDPQMSQKELGSEAMIDECIHILPKQEDIMGAHSYLKRYRNLAYDVNWHNVRQLKDNDIRTIDGSKSWINVLRTCMKLWAIEDMVLGKGFRERQYTDRVSFTNSIFSMINVIGKVCKEGMFCEQKYTDHDSLPSEETDSTEMMINHLNTSRMSGSGRRSEIEGGLQEQIRHWQDGNVRGPAPPGLEHIQVEEHSSVIRTFIEKWNLNEAAKTTLHNIRNIPMALRIMETFNPRSSRVLKSRSRKSQQLQSLVRTKTIQNMLAEQTTLHVGQQVRITQLIRNLERTNARRSIREMQPKQSKVDTTTEKETVHELGITPLVEKKVTQGPVVSQSTSRLRDPITPESELVFSSSPPRQKTASPAEASPPSTPKQCTQSTKKDSPIAETKRRPSKNKNDDFLDDGLRDEPQDDESLEDNKRDGIQPHKEYPVTRIRRFLERARPEETMAFVIGVETQFIEEALGIRKKRSGHDIADTLRERLAFFFDCHKHQVSIGLPSADEIFYEISVSSQGDEDITEEHRKWSWMLTDWGNLYSLQKSLENRWMHLTEIHLQDGTWMFSEDVVDSEGWYKGVRWYKRMKDGREYWVGDDVD